MAWIRYTPKDGNGSPYPKHRHLQIYSQNNFKVERSDLFALCRPRQTSENFVCLFHCTESTKIMGSVKPIITRALWFEAHTIMFPSCFFFFVWTGRTCHVRLHTALKKSSVGTPIFYFKILLVDCWKPMIQEFSKLIQPFLSYQSTRICNLVQLNLLADNGQLVTKRGKMIMKILRMLESQIGKVFYTTFCLIKHQVCLRSL